MMKRLIRGLAGIALAISLVAVTASPAAGVSRPTSLDRLVWNFACVYLAHGTVSPQIALVCTHQGTPQWDARSVKLLKIVCEKGLRGTFDYRSQYPTELSACFFETTR